MKQAWRSVCPSEMPSSNLTPSTGTLTVHQGPGTPSVLYLCHRFSSLVGFRAPCAGSSPRATEQGDSCPVLWQSWGEAACCCPACLPPPRLASLLGKAAAACGTRGFCISPGRTERRERCRTSLFPGLKARFQGGGGKVVVCV